MPLVTIIVISFNYGRFLRTAIDSALAQTYRPLEVIVVDDGSTDGSQTIIASYGSRIKPLLQENRGETAANNAGFAVASGEIVMFLDSDDALRCDAAARTVQEWHAGIAKIQFQLSVIDKDGNTIGWQIPRFPADMSPARIRHDVTRTGGYLWPPTTGNAYARDFLRQVMPLSTEMFPGAPDGAINTVAPLFGNVVTLHETLGCYRIHDTNVWASRRLEPERIAKDILLLQRMAEYFRQQATRLGVAIPDGLDDGLALLEQRIASRRLCPDRHPVPEDSLVGLMRLAAGHLSRSTDPLLRRLLLMLWFGAVAYAPRRAARRIAELRLVGYARPRWLNACLP
jgi:hypothetical protein